MKVFTVEPPLKGDDKKTPEAPMVLPAFKVVEKPPRRHSAAKAVLLVVLALMLAAFLTIVISEYAWKKREGNFFRMRWY